MMPKSLLRCSSYNLQLLRWVYRFRFDILTCRSATHQAISLEQFQASMEGIYSTSVCKETIDESPMAYKPMQEIIECIHPTVEIQKIIKPVYNFKAKG